MKKLLFFLLAAFAQAGFSQQFPARPVKLVVGFTPGGGVDIAARTARAQALGADRPAGDRREQARRRHQHRQRIRRQIGARRLHAAGQHPAVAINMSLYKNLPYDTLRDFAAVSVFSESPNILVVNA